MVVAANSFRSAGLRAGNPVLIGCGLPYRTLTAVGGELLASAQAGMEKGITWHRTA
jgi:hypothetical protein